MTWQYKNVGRILFFISCVINIFKYDLYQNLIVLTKMCINTQLLPTIYKKANISPAFPVLIYV